MSHKPTNDKDIHRFHVVAYDDEADGERTYPMDLDVPAVSEHEARRKLVEEVLRRGLWVWEIELRG